jgi:glycosyltransferase involved in cell wall biosynthesis
VHHVVDSLTFGGAELLLGDLAAVAPEAGLDMTVGYLEDRSGSPAAVRLRQAGVEPTLIAIPPRMYTSAFFRVRRHLAAVKPDIVHTHLGASDVLGGLAARSLGIPSVSTIHSLGAGADAPSTSRERARARVYATGTKLSAARVIAVSESAREEVVRRDGLDPRRVVVIHNGVARHPTPGAGRDVRAEWDVGADALVIATLSGLRPVSAVPRARLVIVGVGEMRRALEDRAAGLGPVVKFAGFRDDVMPVLDAVDVLAHPSLQEAFPTTLLEAMAAGVPQVATEVGGIPEIVQHDRTGLLIPAPPDAGRLAGALVRLLEDPALRETLARQGRELFAQRFEAVAWAGALADLYREVIEEG